jgi:chromosomal replication initiator protein
LSLLDAGEFLRIKLVAGELLGKTGQHVQDRRVTMDSIQKAVAEKFQVKQSQLKEKSNTKKVVFPRQVAMYLVKELTNASLPEIGRAFGGKHHTTVIHSINKIDKERHTDPDLNRLLHSLMDSLQ